MPKPTIGDQELALLRYLCERGQASVGEVAADFGKSNGLARTTVLTMMERMREKAYLRRQRVGGVYRYAPTAAPGDVVIGAVSRFVKNTLSGSVSPFVAWMAERGKVSDHELAELEALVAKLKLRRGGR